MTDDEFEAYPSAFACAQEAHPFGTYERCPRCRCSWHGLPCVQQVPLPVGGGTAPCGCPGGVA